MLHTAPHRLAPLLLAPLLLALGCGDKADDTGDVHGDGGTADDTGAVDYSTTQVSDGGTYTVSYTSDPTPIPFNTEFAVTFSVSGDALPQDWSMASADAFMPSHGHGMNVTPALTDNGDGTWTAAPFLFHMEGQWELSAELTSSAGTETVTFNAWCCE